MSKLFLPAKNTFRKNSIIYICFQTNSEGYHTTTSRFEGLDVNLQQWKHFCRKAWENEYDFYQIHKHAETGGGRYTIRNCNETDLECVTDTRLF